MALSEFREAAHRHLRALDDLIERGSVPRMRKLYTGAIQELEQKLAASIKDKHSPFTVQQTQSLLAQAKHGLARLSASLGTALGEQTAKTQHASAERLVKDIKRLEKAASGAIVRLPIEQASRFAGIVDKRRTSLLKLNKTSMAKYGATVVGKIEQALAMSLLKGEAGYAAVSSVAETMNMEWWRAERIVRTETAWAYNATQMDATAEASKQFPNMMMRWVEFVTDVSLQKMDDRVGDDSVVMHGQLAKPGTYFTMPMFPPRAGLKISPSLRGKQWTNPPNRPNDRAVLQPWRPGWGWGWELVNGSRVQR